MAGARLALIPAVFALVAFGLGADAVGQCASCGNPAFVGGDRDISQAMSGDTGHAWRTHAALIYGLGGFGGYYQNNEAITNLDELKLRMHVLSLVAGAQAPFGTGLKVSMPWARLETDRRFYGENTDQGVGDLEVRLGQDLVSLLDVHTPWLTRAALTVGVVAPTGVYVERENSVANKEPEVSTDPLCQTCGDFCPDHCAPKPVDTSDGIAAVGSSRYLSIGRGSWWLVLDAELAGSLHKRVGWYLGATWRMAMSDAPDGFAWGGEQRVGVGLSGVLWPEVLTTQVLAEYERREMSHDGGVLFDNGGGHFANVSPTLQTSVTDNLNVSLTWRQPVYRDVIGIQAVEGASLWLSVGGRWSFGETANTASGAAGVPMAAAATRTATPTAAAQTDREALREAMAKSPGRAVVGAPPGNKEIADLLVPGKVTVIDYWADWCAPCVRLGAEMKAWMATAPAGVALHKVDASKWSDQQWVQLLPDVPTMPAVDIYDGQGKLLVRLRSEEAFRWRDHLPKVP